MRNLATRTLRLRTINQTVSRIEFQTSERYPRPAHSTPSWFGLRLCEVREQRVGRVRIAVDIVGGGGTIYGHLAAVREAPRSSHGAVSLEEGQAIACDDIEAFMLVGEPPLT